VKLEAVHELDTPSAAESRASGEFYRWLCAKTLTWERRTQRTAEALPWRSPLASGCAYPGGEEPRRDPAVFLWDQPEPRRFDYCASVTTAALSGSVTELAEGYSALYARYSGRASRMSITHFETGTFGLLVKRPSKGKPIWEIAAEIGSRIPPEQWEGVPTDLARNLDHYLYGAPKEP